MNSFISPDFFNQLPFNQKSKWIKSVEPKLKANETNFIAYKDEKTIIWYLTNRLCEIIYAEALSSDETWQIVKVEFEKRRKEKKRLTTP